LVQWGGNTDTLLGEPFERTCRLPQNQALQCSPHYSGNISWAVGHKQRYQYRLHTGRSQVCLPRVPEAWGLGEASIVRRRGHQKLAWTMMQRVFAEGRGCTRECTNWQHRLKMCAKHHRQPCRRRFQTRRIFEWNGEVHSPHPEIEPKKFRYFSQEIHKN
jgi:hypothetical protein